MASSVRDDTFELDQFGGERTKVGAALVAEVGAAAADVADGPWRRADIATLPAPRTDRDSPHFTVFSRMDVGGRTAF